MHGACKKLLLTFLIGILAVGLSAQGKAVEKFTQVPAKIYKPGSGDPGIEIISTQPDLFKDIRDFSGQSKPEYWYWIQLDLQSAKEVIGEEAGFLHPNNFSYGYAYFKKGDAFEEKVIGRFQQVADTKKRIPYTSGIPFTVADLTNGRYLYLKVKRVETFEGLSLWNFGYISETKEYINQNYLSRKNVRKISLIYVFSGICIIMFLLTMAFFLYSKKKEFLFYSLYVLFLLIYLCGPVLELDALFFQDNKLYGYWSIQITQVLINLCYVVFVAYYLNTASLYPKLHLAIKLISATLVLIFLLASFYILSERFNGYIQLMNIQRLLMSVFGLIGMVYLLIYPRSRLVYFIVSGSFLYLIGALGFLFLKQRIYMITGASLEIFIFAIGLTFKIQQEQKLKMLLEKETYLQKAKALRAQINPHFIFNSLGSIQHLITEGNKAGALKYLTKFSRLMRNLMENSIESNIVLTDEIKLLKGYLELEALRFDSSFSFEILVDEAINPDTIEVPVLIIQPYIENAILHGLLHKKDPDKKITITFYKSMRHLICEIDDNGVGRATAEAYRSIFSRTTRSRGMEVTRNRIEMLGDAGMNSIEIIDKIDSEGNAEGTKVILRIPL